MNYKLKNKTAQRLAAAAGFAAIAAGAQAQYNYNNGDLLLVFYQASGASQNLTVDLGSAALYTTATAPITISGYTTAQLNTVFSSLDGLTFAVMGSASGIGGVNGFSQNTLFLSDPASSPTSTPTPFSRHGSSTQSGVSGQIQAVGNNAATFSGNNPSTAVNTATAVSIDNTSVDSYQSINGTSGNLNNHFSGNIENTTPTGFASGGTALRVDGIELVPGSGPGVDFGSFDLNPNGTVVFSPTPEPGTIALCAVGALMGVAQVYRKKRAV
jgi:hypothetical protein